MIKRPIRNLNAEAKRETARSHEKVVASNIAYRKYIIQEQKRKKEEEEERKKNEAETARRREEERQKQLIEEQKKKSQRLVDELAEKQKKADENKPVEAPSNTKWNRKWDLTERLNSQVRKPWEQTKFEESQISKEDQVSNTSDFDQPDFYTKEDQEAYFNNAIKKRADEIYDPQIEQAKQQKRAAIAEYDAYAQRASLSGIGNTIASQLRMSDKIQEADKAIEQITARKNRYIQAMKGMSDPNTLYSGALARTLETSDVYLDSKAKLDEAQARAAASVGTPFHAADLIKFEFEKKRQDLLSKQLDQLQQYLETQQILPRSISQLPKELQDIAEKAFTKDGKLLLNDKEFRNRFNEAQVVEKTQFDELSEFAKLNAMSPAELDEDFINKKKQEYELLKELEESRKTNKATNAVISGPGRGIVGANLQNPEYQIAKKSEAEKTAAINNYDAAISFLDKALHYKQLNEAIASSSNPFYKHFAAYDEFFNPVNNSEAWNTYLFDIPNIVRAGRVKAAADKLESGEKLTDADTALLEALSIENMAHSNWGAFEDDKAYKWGDIAAESLKFMAEFIATRGASSYLQGSAKVLSKKAASAMAKGIEKAVAKNALKFATERGVTIPVAERALQQAALTHVAKYGAAAGTKLTQMATRLGADATYAGMLTTTLGGPRTILDALNDMNGTIKANQDIFGNVQPMGFEDRASETEALARSGVRNWIENFSEMMGEWGMGHLLYKGGKYIPGVGKMLGKIEQGYRRNLVKDIIADAKYYLQHGIVENNALLARKGLRKYIPAVSSVFNEKVLKAGQFHGFLGEVSEEYYGIALQHRLGVADDPNKSVWEDMRDQSIDIWGGIATSTGFLGALGMGHAAHSKLKYNNAVQNLIDSFGEKNATEIQKMLVFSNPLDLVNKYALLATYYGQSEGRTAPQKFKDALKNFGKLFTKEGPTTLEQKVALADYFNSLLELRGAVYGQEVLDRAEGVQWRELRKGAREAGYSVPSYANLQTAQSVEKMLEEDATQQLRLFYGESALSAKEFYELHQGDIVGVNNAIESDADSNQRITGEKQDVSDVINAMVAYHNARNFKEGVDESLMDMARDRVNKVARIANMLTNRNQGKIRVLNGTDEAGNKKRWYWIDGELQTLVGKKEIETDAAPYGKASSKILVSDAKGEYKYIDRSELKRWTIDPIKYDPKNTRNDLIKRETEAEWKRRDQYLGRFDSSTDPSKTIHVGDKRVTILDNKGRNGVTYAVSDENGDNAEIYYAESVDNLNQLVDEINNKHSRNITQMFKKQASDLVKQIMARDKARYEQQLRNDLSSNYAYVEEDYVGAPNRMVSKTNPSDMTDDQIDAEYDSISRYLENTPVDDLNRDIVLNLNKRLEQLDQEMDNRIKSRQSTVTPDSSVDSEEPVEEPVDEEPAATPNPEGNPEQEHSADEWYTIISHANPIDNMDDEELDRQIRLREIYGRDNDSYAEASRRFLEDLKAEKERRVNASKTPSTPTGPAAPAIPQAPVVTISEDQKDQETAYEQLLADIRTGEEQKIDTTSYHYIVNYGGKQRLARRVHSIKKIVGDQEGQWGYEVLRPQIVQRLSAKKNDLDAMFGEVEAIIQELYDYDVAPKTKIKDEKEFNRGGLSENAANKRKRGRRYSIGDRGGEFGTPEYKNVYLDHLKQNPEDVDEVITAISEILYKDFGLSVIAGNVLDVIAREVLSSKRTDELKITDPSLKIWYYGEYVPIEGFIDDEAFALVVSQLKEIKEYYETTLGWKLCTDPYMLCATLMVDGKEMLVAGETDCIAIDKDGKRHIIDFKTHNAEKKYHEITFTDDSLGEITVPSQLYDQASYLPEGYNTAQEYAEQQTIYRILSLACGRKVYSTEALFLAIAHLDQVGDLHATVKTEVVKKGKTVKTNLLPNGKPNRVNLDKWPNEPANRGINKVLDQLEQRIGVLGKTEADILRQKIAAHKFTDIEESLPENIKNLLNKFNSDIDEFLKLEDVSDLSSALANISGWYDQYSQILDEELKKIQLEKVVENKIKSDVKKAFRATKSTIPELIQEFGYDPMVSIMMDMEDDYDRLDLASATDDRIKEIADAVINFKLLEKYAQLNGITETEYMAKGDSFARSIMRALARHGYNDQVNRILDEVAHGNFQYSIADDVVAKKSIEITGLQDRAAKAKTVVACHDINNPENKLFDQEKGVDILSNPDFIKHADFYIQRDATWTGEEPRFEMVIVYNGVEYTPITINIAHKENGTLLPDAKVLYNNLIALTEEGGRVKVNNDAIHRTFGEFKKSNGLNKVDVKSLLGLNLSDITYDHRQSNVGIVRMVEGPNGPAPVVQMPSATGAQRRTFYVYSDSDDKKTKPAAGGIVLMYKPGYEETSAEEKTSQNSIPINLESTTFDNDTAQFVADILDKVIDDQMFLSAHYKTAEGAETPFTNQQALEFFISYGASGYRSGREHVHVSIRNGKVFIKGLIKGADSSEKYKKYKVGSTAWEFDIKNGERAAFTEFLCDFVRMQIDEDFMKKSLENSYALKKWFNERTIDEIKFGNSPISFTREDAEQELSGIAWYIRSGMLQTRFNGLLRPLISLDEKTLLGTQMYSEQQEQPQNNNLDPNSGISFLSTVQLQEADSTIDEQEARERIREIVGDVYVPDFEDEVLKVLSNGVVVGACYENMIKLSRMAKRGTEYHEAFHRVLELLVDEKTRNKAYKKYRAKFGKNLTDIEIAERAADEFWWFKDNKPARKFSWNLLEMLKILRAWYKFFTKIGSYTLYKLYKDAASGKYKNSKPTAEAKARWQALTKENGGFLASTYIKDGIEYKSVMNRKEYEAVVETIRFIALSPATYTAVGRRFDPTGAHLNELKLDAKTIIESPITIGILRSENYSEDAKNKLMEVLGVVTDGKTLTKVNNRLDNVLAEVVAGLNEYQVRGGLVEQKVDKYGVPIEQQKSNEGDNTGENPEDDPSAPIEGGEYSKQSWEFDPATRTTPRVKFFFSRFMDVEPIYIFDEKSGKVTITPSAKLNAAGLPQLASFDRAWGMMINQLHHCKGQLELLDRLKVLSSFDGRFLPAYTAYKGILEDAYEKDPITKSIINKQGRLTNRKKGDNAEQAYGFAKEIVKAICNSKQIPNVAESMQSDTKPELNGSLRVFESSMEYVVQDIRKSWSVNFASGNLEFVKRKPNGRLVLENKDELVRLKGEIQKISWLFQPLSRGELSKRIEGLTISIECRTLTEDKKLKGRDQNVIKSWSTVNEILEAFDNNDQTFFEAVKQQFVKDLNRLGIELQTDDLDFCLRERSGDLLDGSQMDRADWQRSALCTFFIENSKGIGALSNTIQRICNAETQQALKEAVTDVWSKSSKNPFIDTISVAKYRRRSAEYMLSYLTIGGKKQYAISEHNHITDVIDEFKRNDQNKDGTTVLQDLLDDPYHQSSRTLQFIDNSHKEGKSLEQMNFIPLPGLKTDAHGSIGVEYLDMSEQEDVVTKYSLLADNQLILETLSDKTTWGSIKMPFAFKAFGIDWVTDKDDYNTQQRLIDNENRVISLLRTGGYRTSIVNGRLHFEFDDDVLDQFIQYAYSEYESAKAELERYNDLSEEEKIQNFHKNKNGVIQGARMSTFTGIIKDDGTFVSFNNKNKSEAVCLQDAEREFFGLTKRSSDPTLKNAEQRDVETQRRLMSNILSNQLQKELDWLKQLGLISQTDNGYTNIGLDKVKLRKLMRWIYASQLMNTDHNLEQSEALSKANSVTEFKPDIQNQAILAYVADMVAKSQMSHQEFYRMFGGNLAYYEWRYDEETGELTDSTTDFFKRMGGLVSTGEHNVIDDFENELYTCAEMEDEYFESPMFEDFEEIATKQQFKKLLANILKAQYTYKDDAGKEVAYPITIENCNTERAKEAIAKINEELDSLSTQQLKNRFKELSIDSEVNRMKADGINVTAEMRSQVAVQIDNLISSEIAAIQKQAKAISKAKLDVNDGATYITDEFAEKLLRAIGKWDAGIAKAFAILRNTTSVDDKNMREVAESYNKVYTTVVGTQKYTAFGFRPNVVNTKNHSYTRNDVYYDKTAYFPLFTCMCTGHLKAVLKKMHDEKVDVLKTTSAIKEGGRGAVKCDHETFKDWDKNPESFQNFHFNSYQQRFKDLRKQFNTDPKDKEYMTLGSQYQKVVMLLLHAEQVYDVNGEELNAKEVREQIMDCYTKIAQAGKERHDSKFYDKHGHLKVDIFVNQLKKQVDDRDASDQLRKYIDVETVETIDESTGEKRLEKRLKLPVSALASTEWIQSIITSIINKELIDVSGPGQAFYQRSAWGAEGQMSQELGNVISQNDEKYKDFAYSINHGAPLKEKNELGSMDVVLSIDFFNYIFEQHPGLVNQSFSTKKAWLIKNGIISGFIEEKDKNLFDASEIEEIDGKLWHNAKTQIVGYRIPTQAVSSIHAMRCVDVIMAVRDTIIMPKEVTGVTGSDFDIDKFFLSTLYYMTKLYNGAQEEIDKMLSDAGFENQKQLRDAYEKVKSEENDEEAKKLANIIISIDKVRRQNSKQSTEFDPETNTKEHYYNKLILTQIALLTTNDNNLSQLHGSIDVDTERLKEIAKEIQKKDGVRRIDPLDASSLRVAVQAKLSFAIGKKGIGPYALNNNNHVFTMLYGVKFNDDKGILHDLDLLDLSKGVGIDGRSIPSWISGLINAHVDVAKDPYIRSLGVNEYTYNLVSLLIRTGYGENTFWFTTQPAMKKLYNEYDKAAGVYKQNEAESKYSRTNKKVQDFVIQYLKTLTKRQDIDNVDSAIDAFDAWFKGGEHGVSRRSAIKALMKYKKGQDVLHYISTTPEDQLTGKEFDIGISRKVAYEEIQALVLIANHQLQKKAQELSDLVQYTKIDTKKQGKTVAQQYGYLAKMETLLDPKTSPFEIKSIQKMINGTFIGPKTRSSIAAQKRLLSTQLLEATPGFQKLLDDISERLHSSRIDESYTQSISDMLVAKLKSDYFFRGIGAYCVRRGIDPVQIMKDPVRSIHAQLLTITSGILNKNDHRFDSVRNADGTCNNYLLNNLVGHFKNDVTALYGIENRKGAKDENFQGTDFADDSWENTLFISNLHPFDDSIKSSDMQNAWEDLLNDTSHPELQRFAEELIVYAFLTSASNGGKHDLFRFVPYSWITGDCELLKYSGIPTFAEYISDLIYTLNDKKSELLFSDDEVDEMIANFSNDDNIVKVVSAGRINSMPSLDTQNGTPIIVGALIEHRSAFLDGQYPGYFKVDTGNTDFKYGQRKYNLYKLVGHGIHKYTDGKGKVNTIPYPIYVLMQPRGGFYKDGQRIYDMGVQNASSNFRKLWNRGGIRATVNDIKESVSDMEVSRMSPEQLFRQIAYITKYKKDEQKTNGIKVSKIFNRDMNGYLKEIVNDFVNNGDSNIPSFVDWWEQYERDSESNTQAVDFNKTSTELLLQDIKDEHGKSRYTASNMQTMEDLGVFVENLKEVADHLNQKYGIHLEFYKKESEDGTHWNPTITVSYNNKKAFGFFEISAEIDLDHKEQTGEVKYTGQFAVHFKTYSYKDEKNTRYATAPLSRWQKTELTQALLMLMPKDATVSTRGTLSPGGKRMLDTLDSYYTGETGKLVSAGTQSVELKTKDGIENVEIPIWKKETATNLDAVKVVDKTTNKPVANKKEISETLTSSFNNIMARFFNDRLGYPTVNDVQWSFENLTKMHKEIIQQLVDSTETSFGMLTQVKNTYWNRTEDYSKLFDKYIDGLRLNQDVEEKNNSCEI